MGSIRCFLCDGYKIDNESDDARFCEKCNALVHGALANKGFGGQVFWLLSRFVLLVVLACATSCISRACIAVHAEAHGRDEYPLDLLHCEACRSWWDANMHNR